MTHYIHYRGSTRQLCALWHDMPGKVICRGKGKGPHNVLLETKIGREVDMKRWFEATCYINGSRKSTKVRVMADDREQAVQFVYCKLYSDRKNKEFKIANVREA